MRVKREEEEALEMAEMGESMRGSRLAAVVTKGVRADITADLGEFERRMHQKAEQFDPKVERAFHWLQACTACLDSLAHGLL